MKKGMIFLLLICCAAFLSACRSKYNNPTYVTTDTYRDAFQGNRVPQDVR